MSPLHAWGALGMKRQGIVQIGETSVAAAPFLRGGVVTALQQIDNEFEAVSASLKVPFFKTFLRVTVPVCLPSILEIGRYFFVVSMASLSTAIFLYTPDTILASVAIKHLDQAGDIGPAAALASLIVVTSVVVSLVYSLATRVLLARTQAWRNLRR